MHDSFFNLFLIHVDLQVGFTALHMLLTLGNLLRPYSFVYVFIYMSRCSMFFNEATILTKVQYVYGSNYMSTYSLHNKDNQNVRKYPIDLLATDLGKIYTSCEGLKCSWALNPSPKPEQ